MPTDPFYLSAVWRTLRAAALKRDDGRCAVEGCQAKAVVVDHIVSRRKGGPDTLDNLRCLCRSHDNQVKETASGGRRRGGVPVAFGCDVDGWPIVSR